MERVVVKGVVGSPGACLMQKRAEGLKLVSADFEVLIKRADGEASTNDRDASYINFPLFPSPGRKSCAYDTYVYILTEDSSHQDQLLTHCA